MRWRAKGMRAVCLTFACLTVFALSARPAKKAKLSWANLRILAAYDNAEVQNRLQKSEVYISGYATPMRQSGAIQTFLLSPVPHPCDHGACPPSEQMVLVETREKLRLNEGIPIAVTGQLVRENIRSQFGTIYFSLKSARIMRKSGS